MKKYGVLFIGLSLVGYISLLPLALNIYLLYIHIQNWHSHKSSLLMNIIVLKVDKSFFEKYTLHSNKEIIINNNLYDIIDYQINDDGKVNLKVIKDDREEFILDKLKKLFSWLTKSYFSSILLIFSDIVSNYSFKPCIFSVLYRYHIFTDGYPMSVFIEQIIPPPNFI